MAWLVLVLSIGAIFLLMVMIRDGEMSKVASLFYLVPAVTAVIAWLLFGEQLKLVQIVGMALATFGVGAGNRANPAAGHGSQAQPLTPADAGARLQIAADRGIEFAAEDEDRRDDVEEDHRDHDRGKAGIGRHIGRETVEIGGEDGRPDQASAISVKMMPGTIVDEAALAGRQPDNAPRTARAR